jgi:hypothetical protein
VSAPQILYIFLDEAGDLHFSTGGTHYLMLGSIAVRRPLAAHADLDALRHELIEDGLSLDRFHAAEDRQVVGDRVFAMIIPQLQSINSVVVEKRALHYEYGVGAFHIRS